MNKYKKIAAAVVSTVMAGTMVASLAACNNDKPSTGSIVAGATGNDLFGVMNSDNSINYDKYQREGEVTLNLAVGHEKTITSTFYDGIKDAIKMPDGKTYNDGDVKPAWAQMGKDLDITWKNVWDGSKTSANLNNLINGKDESGNSKYANVDLFTSDLSVVVDKVSGGTSVLNLGDYLAYMPHFKQFLESNPVVYLSLLQDGMSTEDGSGKTLYVAPYFDGYDDIERYCLVRQDWSSKLLNGTSALTNAGVAYNSVAYNKVATGSTYKGTHVNSYFGQTGVVPVESANEDGTAKITIYKNYANVLSEIKKDGSALKSAYEAMTGAAYDGTSGNIVDIQNKAIAAKPYVTGKELVELFRAYIDACYTKTDAVGAESYYAPTKRANLFNGCDACWDVDDLVAILRCVLTNGANLSTNPGALVGGIMPRSGQNDRTPDIVSLAGQLYGVRGTTSRLEQTYIDNTGKLHDAREEKEIYQAMENFNLLVQEGLIGDYTSKDKFSGYGGLVTVAEKQYEYFMMYDYSQTQTLGGFYVENDDVTPSKAGTTIPCDDYYFSAVVTPVAKWDVDCDGNHTDVMRFTESWRSTKTGGLALNGSLAEAGNEEKLKAALQFVDYLYSEDGQIVSTYGPMAENAEGKNGFWYNTQATPEQVTAGNYFTYKGVKYSGSDYKGKTTPTITNAVYRSFMGNEVNDWKLGDNSNVSGAKLSFTNYARYLIGSTLPVGVKDQSFENQLTSKMGQAGALRVGKALDLGVIKGVSLEVDSNNYWYTCVPTSLPVDAQDQKDILNTAEHNNFMYMTGKQKDSKNFFSIFNWIVLYGNASKYNQQGVECTYSSINNLLESTITGTSKNVKTLAGERRSVYGIAWNQAKSYWAYLDSQRG